ncbi:MAG TPA: methanol/ethanol family PQQ-dependent dehydrogenase [Gammaproteobacteria bacterium]|nr:methanol/ethanol family PQQ-dependent dehydrogenase [Gammaproteobacteria bacterium]
MITLRTVLARVRLVLPAVLCLLAFAPGPEALAAGPPAYKPVTAQRLLHAESDSGWLMYRRAYNGQGYAPFTQITPKNVSHLKIAFTYKTGMKLGHEAAPIVNGRYMFITTPKDHVIALDATTGKVLWKYQRKLARGALKTVCCGFVNRGVALYGDKVYLTTLDNHVVALKATTGKVVWNTGLEKAGVGYAMTVAPLVVDGRVIVGESGGEFGARDFIAALDAETGKLDWKRYTIPGPNQPGGDTWPKGDAYKHGGGPAWNTGTYDPASDTLYWGVGNPSPWLASKRPGKNLYTDSLLALNPHNGKIKWHYQYTPHDGWDYDGVNTPVLTDIPYHGKTVKALLHADRNGWFYALERSNGKFLWAKPFVKTNTITRIKPDGTPVENDKLRPTVGKKSFVCPSPLGGKNWWPMSVDPKTGMAYVPTLHACATLEGKAIHYRRGMPYYGETGKFHHQPGTRDWGAVQAISIKTGKQVWVHHSKMPWNGGMLSTASGLVFSGSLNGHFYAFDANTGKVLWKSPKLHSGIVGVPTTYEVDGHQYVAVYSGFGGVLGLFAHKMTSPNGKHQMPRGGELYVFKLD